MNKIFLISSKGDGANLIFYGELISTPGAPPLYCLLRSAGVGLPAMPHIMDALHDRSIFIEERKEISF